MIKLQQVDLRDKRVLLRADLNVSQENGEITSDYRIRATLDSIRFALEENASVLVISHFGRPIEGQFDDRYSLVSIRDLMQKLLGRPVKFFENWIDGVDIQPGQVALCENVRFLNGEKACDKTLSQKMARLCDVFVMDAFGAAHRAHASISGVAHYAPVACLGLQCQKEVDSLDKALNNPAKPVVAIVGGAKVDGKLQALRRLTTIAQTLIVGGGIANTFLSASGFNVGRSLCETELLSEASEILKIANENGCAVPLSDDVVVAESLDDRSRPVSKNIQEVSEQDMILDIGCKTREHFCSLIDESRTIIWNGPVGAFEFPPFDAGTRAITSAVVESDAFSVAGGGDTVAALERFDGMDKVSYVSTGGGAFLEYVQGNQLPAFAALDQHVQRC